MRGPESGSSSPDGFSILGGIFHILFGLFFLIPLFFPLMILELILTDGPTSQMLLLFLGSIVVLSPFIIIGIFVLMTGYSMITGWDPAIKSRRPGPGNPLTRNKRQNVVFGGHRESFGPIFLTMLVLPLLVFGPIGIIYGLMLFFGDESGSDACILTPISVLFTWGSYWILSKVLTKRTLRIDHKNGILFSQTTLFGRRVEKEIRPIVEVLEVKAWTSYTDGGLERVHLVIYGEGQKGQWSMDLSIMAQTNFIDPKKVARALGVPLQSKLEDNKAELEKFDVDLDELIEQDAEDAKIKAEKDKKNKFFLGAAIFLYLLGFVMEGEAQGFLKIYFVAGTVCLILQYLVSIGKIGFGEGGSDSGGIDWGNDDYW